MPRIPAGFCLFLLVFAACAAHADTWTVTELADDGDETCDASCTLRDAMLAAILSPEASEIRFAGGLRGTITLASTLIAFGADVTINGPGPDVITVSGDDQFPVMEILSHHVNVTIRGLTIRDGFHDGSSSGAGIIAGGTNLLLEDLRVIDNHNSGQGAGILLYGGGTVRNTEISGNSDTQIAGLLINGSQPVLVENVTISGNTAAQQNSALRVLTNSGQDVILRYLTVAHNTGGQIGANISNPGGSTVIEASVFAGNEVSNGDLVVSADTVVNNSVVQDLEGTITLGANNLIGVDPQLFPLGFASGLSQRLHAINDASPAFDHVDNGIGNPQCGGEVVVDQAGNPRPAGTNCDAGAFEAEPGRIFWNGYE